MRPKQGVTRREAAKLARTSAKSGLVAIVDEPLNTGNTMLILLGLLRRAGIPSGHVVTMLPLHPTRRDWTRESGDLAAARAAVVLLRPEETHKMRLLAEQAGPAVVRSYFEHNGLTVRGISEEQCLNAALDGLSEQKFHSRLKKVYRVEERRMGLDELSRLPGRRPSAPLRATGPGLAGWDPLHRVAASARGGGERSPAGFYGGGVYRRADARGESGGRPRARHGAHGPA
jgi:hypothetical protein